MSGRGRGECRVGEGYEATTKEDGRACVEKVFANGRHRSRACTLVLAFDFPNRVLWVLPTR